MREVGGERGMEEGGREGGTEESREGRAEAGRQGGREAGREGGRVRVIGENGAAPPYRPLIVRLRHSISARFS